MENTLENKAKFISLYWGQRVLMTPLDNVTMRSKVCGAIEDYVRNSYLELTPLFQITDEDAIVVGKMLSYYSDEINIERRENEIWMICDEYIKVIIGVIKFGILAKSIDGEPSEVNTHYNKDIVFYENEMVGVIDYLRSKGYALPWMGLSVEQQIEFGWIKLKEN